MGSDSDGQAVVKTCAPDRRDQIELPADLVPYARFGFKLLDPVRQEAVRIFTAMGETQGNVGEQTEERRRQGTLCVHGENHSTIEMSIPQLLRHRVVGGAALSRR